MGKIYKDIADDGEVTILDTRHTDTRMWTFASEATANQFLQAYLDEDVQPYYDQLDDEEKSNGTT